MGQMNIAPKRRIDFTEYGAGYVSEAVGHAFSYPEPVLMSERSSEAEAKEYLLNIAEEMMMAGWIVEVELVVGGAAAEIEISVKLAERAATMTGINQYIYRYYADFIGQIKQNIAQAGTKSMKNLYCW